MSDMSVARRNSQSESESPNIRRRKLIPITVADAADFPLKHCTMSGNTKNVNTDKECELSLVVLNCANANTPYQLAIVRNMVSNEIFVCHSMELSIVGSEQYLDQYIWHERPMPVSEDNIVVIATADIVIDLNSSSLEETRQDNGLFSCKLGPMHTVMVISELVRKTSSVTQRNEALRLCDQFSNNFLDKQFHPREDLCRHIPPNLLSDQPPQYTVRQYFDILKTLYYIPPII
jgi:hypothetical protein